MNLQTINPILSFPDVVQTKKPRELFEDRLISLLKKRLKTYRIIWSPKAFRGGLNSPELPAALLRKLESIILLSEAVDWRLSKTLINELDNAVEDIETFNPPFRESLRRASRGAAKGRHVTLEEMGESVKSAR